MLACVCLNPSFDRTVSLRSFTAGDVNRVLSARQGHQCRHYCASAGHCVLRPRLCGQKRH